MPDLAFKHLTSERSSLFCPATTVSPHGNDNPRDIEGETFVNVSDNAPTLRVVIDNYLSNWGVSVATAHRGGKSLYGVSRLLRQGRACCRFTR